MFEEQFLDPGNDERYREAITTAVETLLRAWPRGPYDGSPPAQLAALWSGEILPRESVAPEAAWDRIAQCVSHSIALSNPRTIAHLHPPALIASMAADVVIAAMNQSMDSFDQGPAATMLELAMSEWLCGEIGFQKGAGGVFTAGGTQSNFMGLLLARDAAAERHWRRSTRQDGLPAEASRMRFLCSEVAHFTVEKSAYQLGLGSNAVIKVPVDASFRMDPTALAWALQKIKSDGLVAAAVVATAGTTDFGSIDPLAEISRLAHQNGAWFHIDGAYGSALLLSKKHRTKLSGIEQADSVGVDFHKKFWQGISCAAFVLRDAAKFRYLEVHADYLNPESHEEEGIPDLVGRSLATTRRLDALKLWLSFQLIGREKFAAMIDRTLELAACVAGNIRARTRFELINKPEMGCVVFRYLPEDPGADADRINRAIRDRMFERSEAVLGHTRVRGRQCLKFTCMNPVTKENDLETLVERIQIVGKSLETEFATDPARQSTR